MAITKEQLGKVRLRMNALLSDLGTEFGAELIVGRISYTDNTATIKVEMSTLDETGEAITKEAEDFRLSAHVYGMSPDDLYKKFKHAAENYMLIGCSPRSRTYPILCKNLNTGKISKFPPSLAIRCLKA